MMMTFVRCFPLVVPILAIRSLEFYLPDVIKSSVISNVSLQLIIINVYLIQIVESYLVLAHHVLKWQAVDLSTIMNSRL